MEGVTMKLKRFVSIMIVMMMLFSSLVPAMAQSSGGDIDLKLNESVLAKGQELVIAATVNKEGVAFANGEVIITVKNDVSKNVIFVKQLLTDEAGKISTRFVIGDTTELGMYNVELSSAGTQKISKFQVIEKKPAGSVSTDKASYQLGEAVKIKGRIAAEGGVLANRTAIIKVFVKDELVFIKELLTDEEGSVATSFVTSKNIGTYNVQLSSQGHELTTSFEVTQKEIVDEVVYQIDGSANKWGYKGGETAKITGTASTTKNGVKVWQDKITVSLMNGKVVIASRTLNVAKNGRFAVDFKLDNTTANYDVVLKNNTAEKVIKLSVTEVKNVNPGTTTPASPTTGGSSTGGPYVGGSVGGTVPNVPQVPAKATSTDKPAMVKGKVASASIAVKAKEATAQKASAVISAEDVKKAMETLNKTDAASVELRLEMEPTTAKTIELKVPVAEIVSSSKQEVRVLVVSNGLSVQVPMKGIQSKSASDMLSVQFVKMDTANMGLSKGVEAKDGFKVSATMSTGEKIPAESLNLNIALTDYKLDYDKAVLVKMGNDGKFVVAGNKIVAGNLTAEVVSGENYFLVERTIEFKDINAHWSEKFVESMASKGVVSGYENGTFNPEKSVTRAEFVTMLIKAMDLDLVTAGKSFKDIDSTNWANQYIETAYSKGIVKGSNGNFNPDAKITRAEMAVMIANAMKLSGSTTTKPANDTPEWATDAISAVMADGIMAGNEGQFRPNDLANRAESATVIYKVFNQKL